MARSSRLVRRKDAPDSSRLGPLSSRHRRRSTGSATAAAAALLADLSSQRDGELKLRVGQGVDMGRPSLLLTRVRKENGAVASAHVGGACVQMMEGSFRL